MNKTLVLCLLGILLSCGVFAQGTQNNAQEIAELKAQILEMRRLYDARIAQMQAEIDELKRKKNTPAEAIETPSTTVQTQRNVPSVPAVVEKSDLYTQLKGKVEQWAAPVSKNANLDISAIIDMNFHHDNAKEELAHIREEMSGFGHHHGEEEEEEGHHHHHHGDKNGFNLHHIELGLSAEVDPYFRAWTTLAFEDEESVEIEEAVIQTTNLPYGLTLSGGKIMSGIGRINRQHSHNWDFADIPLVYDAFFGDHGLREKGVQLTWLAPTPFYLLFGTELGNGDNEKFSNHVGGDELPDHDDPRLFTSFIKIAPDLGDKHAMQFGLNFATGHHQLAEEHDEHEHYFDGRNYLYGIDWVYKYSANGSHGMGDITLQGEYFYRDSRMKLLNNDHHYENKQDGYYIQALYGIAPRWRVGARWEQLGLVNECEDPHEGSWSAPSSYRMAGVVDWKLSEYSMLRFQVARHSYSTEEEREKAWEFTFQLQISLGSHPAHDF